MLLDLVIALALGALLGIWLGRRTSQDRQRRLELESELAATRASAARYREEVSTHFVRTSELVKGLTLQYRAVYDHLAEGARQLCPERMVEIGHTGGMQALLAAGAAEERAVEAEPDTVETGRGPEPTAPGEIAVSAPQAGLGAAPAPDDGAEDGSEAVRRGADAEAAQLGEDAGAARLDAESEIVRSGADTRPDAGAMPPPSAGLARGATPSDEPVAEVGPPPLSRYAFRSAPTAAQGKAGDGADAETERSETPGKGEVRADEPPRPVAH